MIKFYSFLKSYLVTVDEAEAEVGEAEVEEDDSESEDEAQSGSSGSSSDDAAEETVEDALELTKPDCETIMPDLRNCLLYLTYFFPSLINHNKLLKAQSNQVQPSHQIQS